MALWDVGILPLLPGSFALVAGAPPNDSGYHLVALVGVDGLHELDHQGAGVFAVLLLNVQHPFDAVDGVSGAQVAEELPVVAGEETVDAGKAPAGPARPMPHEGGAGVSDYGAV